VKEINVHKNISSLLSGVFILLAFLPASGQNIKAVISGRVIDQHGAAIRDAQVTVTDITRGFERRVASDADGAFYQAGLEPGTYSVEVSMEGFETYRASNLELRVGDTGRIEAELHPRRLEEKIEVTSGAVILRVDDARHSRSFSRDEMNDLPVQAGGQGRNFYAQARTAPGVTISTQAHQPFAVSGNRPRSNNYLVDSIDTTDANTGLIAGRGVTEQLVSQEAVASLEILTHNFKAEYGRNSGGMVSLVSKSGTNEFHGSVYEYHNNSALSARNFFETNQPSRLSNLGGFTLGGPIKRNKAHFFGQYEIFRVRGSAPSIYQGLTDAERASAVPEVRALVDLFPRIPTGSRIFAVGVPSSTDQSTYLVRGDIALTPTQSLMARVSNTISDRQSLGVGNIVNSSAPGKRRTLGATVQHNFILGPTVLNEFRVGYNRQVEHDSETPEPLFLGDPALNGELGLLRVTGLNTAGIPSFLNQYLFQNNYQVVDDLTLSRGRHAVKLGSSVRRIQVNGGNIDNGFRGQLTFNSIADFLAGRPAVYTRNIGNPRVGLRRTEFQSYAQDDWRITPTLTLNIGLRYELNTAPREVANRIPDQYLLETDRNNLAPRFGIAWQPAARTVVRAGYGIYYNVLETTFLGLTRFNPPFITNLNAVRPSLPNLLDNARQSLPSGLVIPNPDTRTPYAQHVNVTVERELSNPQSTISAAYVGTFGRKLSRALRPNGGEQLPQAERPDQTLGVVNVLETSANSDYQSLQVGYSHRLSGDVQVRAAYTYSKFIDDVSDIPTANQGLGRDVIPFNGNDHRLDRAVSNYDVPHVFTFTYIWRIPFLRGNRFLGGWTISGINTLHSGRPFTLYSGTNTPEGNNNNRPLDIAGALERHPSSSQPISFADGVTRAQLTPAPGRYGTVGRNTERGDSFLDFNVSLSKDFAVTERVRFQVRGEVFNMFNVTNFNGTDGVMTSPNFGRAVSAFDPRRAQLAARVVF
jgi:hypothetical protein